MGLQYKVRSVWDVLSYGITVHKVKAAGSISSMSERLVRLVTM